MDMIDGVESATKHPRYLTFLSVSSRKSLFKDTLGIMTALFSSMVQQDRKERMKNDEVPLTMKVIIIQNNEQNPNY
jgi:hypothetical protein